MCVCVCVCVYDKERERKLERKSSYVRWERASNIFHENDTRIDINI